MRIYNTRAFTLTEVIVATAVASIVLLGVVTSNISLQKTSMDASNSFYLSQGVANTVKHIMTSASLAVGTPRNPGILVGTGWTTGSWNVTGTVVAVGNLNSVCFHQNVNHLANGDDVWPGLNDSSKDRWSCYTYLPTNWTPVSADRRKAGSIYWCTMAYSGASSPATDCVHNSRNLTIVGEAGTVVASLRTSTAMFSLSISNCATNTTSGTVPNSTINNPCITKTSSTYPPGHTAG